jgi:uncharacterized repeat protein (TIGR03943 family)
VKYRRLLLALVGLTCLRLALTGQYKQYVRVGMGRYLALAGIALGLLALADIVLHRSAEAGHEEQSHPHHAHDDREDEHPHEHDQEDEHQHGHGYEHNDHGHDHSSTPKIAWLLLLPIAVAFAVAPPALGKWGIDRSSNAAIAATRKSNYLPLKPSAAPLPMATNEFVARAFDESGSSIKGVTISIEGFVIERNDNYVVIGRYSIACCAADAVAAQVHVLLPGGQANTPGESGPQGEWVRATGTLTGSDNNELPILAATELAAIRPPSNTYEG